jgi:16S rRNA (adenine1518-N6/adenine1519-N6)-dimethyltransferase
MQFKFFSINEIQNFISTNGLIINKRFGQNFLINSGVVDTILNNSGINENDLVFEIGCGLGSLTHRILEKNCILYGFEIDRAYINHLKNLFSENKRFILTEGDFLKKIETLIKKINFSDYNKIIFLGNLPYNITTPILDKIFSLRINFDYLVFMLQKEVGERIIAKEGSKKYGSLSIFCQYYTIPKIIANISPKSFYPMPNVDSVLIQFEKNKTVFPLANEDLFFKVARSLFISRRKQIKNNLMLSPFLKFIPEEKILSALKSAEIPFTVRGETLSIEKIIILSNELNKIL